MPKVLNFRLKNNFFLLILLATTYVIVEGYFHVCIQLILMSCDNVTFVYSGCNGQWTPYTVIKLQNVLEAFWAPEC